MSSLLSAELSATCNALGTYDKKNGKYLVDEYTLSTIKDLIRYLRKDGDDHEIRIHLGQTKILQTDLVPLLIDHWENTELFDVTLRLLVNLTNPALLLYREDIPSERTARHNYLQILQHLQSYKEEAFTKVEVWNILSKKIAKILEIEWNERDEDTGLIIERILILIRNILHVPADPDNEKKPENDASVHDQVLWALNQSGFLDIILYMSSENEKQYFMHILEIISLMFREQNPSSLADAALQRSVDEKLRDEQELLAIRMNENKIKSEKVKQFSSARHSRFGGTYVVQNMKSISDNELIYLKPLNKIANLDFGGKKEKLKRPKNRRPVEYQDVERRSAFAIRLFLKEFCIEFLNASYNPLMRYVRDILMRAKTQQNDESYYLWAIKFFMEFNRGHNFDVALVSETMAVTIFHYVQQQMEKYYDMIKVEKKKYGVWVKRLHLALRAYKELLNTLSAMDKSNDVSVRESAKVLKSNIFYVLEYREFILHMLFAYNDAKMPRAYLVDLIETVHLFTKMLEHFCKKTGLVVQKRIKKKSKKKNTNKQKSKIKPNAQKTQSMEDRSELWSSEVSTQMSAVVRSLPESTMPQVPPFDAASETPIDEQKETCVKRIQKHMMEHNFEEAVALFRAAREVWLEEGLFGNADVTQDEELDMLESIFVAELGVETDNTAFEENLSEEDDDEDEEDEEDANNVAISETEFQFSDFSSRFCQPSVAAACSYLLEGFQANVPYTNHCALKMLHRIAWDNKSPALMYQASLFRTFQKILASDNDAHKELKKFAIFILRKFTETAKDNPKIFMELIFWKTISDANEIELGFHDGIKAAKNTWTEEQEEELRSLYMENQRNPSTEQDVIDWIIENLVDQSRTRRGVVKKLKDLGLIFKAPTKKSNAMAAKERQRQKEELKHFGEHEDEMLADLWDQFKNSNDPISAILSRMPIKRQKKRYIERMLELGIIKNKKECRKRTIKSGQNDEISSEDSEAERSSSQDSDSESVSNDFNRTPKPKKQIIKRTPTLNQSKSKKITRKAPEMLIYSRKKVSESLLSLGSEEWKPALEWLMECIEEVALDQEAEGYDDAAEGVPLVPIMTESIEAIQNKTFQEILKNIGIQPPDNEQEQYWRIPSKIHFEELRKRNELIKKALQGSLILDDDEGEGDETCREKTFAKDSSDDEDQLFDNLRKMTNNVRETTTLNDRNALHSDSSDDETNLGHQGAFDDTLNQQNLSKDNAKITECELTSPSRLSVNTRRTSSNSRDSIDLIINRERKRKRLLSDNEDLSDIDENINMVKNKKQRISSENIDGSKSNDSADILEKAVDDFNNGDDDTNADQVDAEPMVLSKKKRRRIIDDDSD